VANIGGSLVAVLAFIAFLNGILGWCGTLIGIENLSFEFVLGKIFIPLAWLLGVPSQV
jgi:nucleoside permease NupC